MISPTVEAAEPEALSPSPNMLDKPRARKTAPPNLLECRILFAYLAGISTPLIAEHEGITSGRVNRCLRRTVYYLLTHSGPVEYDRRKVSTKLNRLRNHTPFWLASLEHAVPTRQLVALAFDEVSFAGLYNAEECAEAYYCLRDTFRAMLQDLIATEQEIRASLLCRAIRLPSSRPHP